MFKLKTFIVLVFLLVVAVSICKPQEQETEIVRDVVSDAFSLIISTTDIGAIDRAFLIIDAFWQPAFVPQLLDIMSVPRSDYVFEKTIDLLIEKTGEDFGNKTNDWYFWLWRQSETILPGYADFKADLYGQIDPPFETYFRGRQSSAHIRLDEVRWGGVVQDGIPPLRNPEMISASQATYLDDENIVFGLEINGDLRAYPKRILAWHELFTDTIGGVGIAGVYCTLCGTVTPYKTSADGVDYLLGTSGFLYRSNKLMYDQATQSLWSSMKGEPVIGPLAGKGIVLEHLSVVTTTWGEWKRRHPDTKVLSLNTGHRRDYGENRAYQSYFSSDRLMFNTPFQDDRLKNKEEVLALSFPASPQEQLAIDTAFLNRNPLYKSTVGQQRLVVLTDRTGANRVYDPGDIVFVSYDRDSIVTDSAGRQWKMTEDGLESPDRESFLDRLPARRAFWFGWHAAYPETRLVK